MTNINRSKNHFLGSSHSQKLTHVICCHYLVSSLIEENSVQENRYWERREREKEREPKFMALRALGRSRVMTATPFGCTFPLTNSSVLLLAPAIIEKFRWLARVTLEKLLAMRENLGCWLWVFTKKFFLEGKKKKRGFEGDLVMRRVGNSKFLISFEAYLGDQRRLKNISGVNDIF